MHLHHASELFFDNSLMTDMSQISAIGLNHATLMYDLNNKLKEKVAGH